jgi:hypothetical protein
MLSDKQIVTGTVKVTIEEADAVEEFEAFVDGRPVTGIDIFCADPRPPRYEINFNLPEQTPPGIRQLTVRLGHRHLGSFAVTVR